jgi:four helix bundle protein
MWRGWSGATRRESSWRLEFWRTGERQWRWRGYERRLDGWTARRLGGWAARRLGGSAFSRVVIGVLRYCLGRSVRRDFRMPESRPHFLRLDAGRACYQLAVAVYEATRRWPREERFGLVSQARRAAYSSAANIAEGSARRGSKEFRRFLDISLASLAELEFALWFAKDCGILSPADWGQLEPLLVRAGSLTGGLARAIRLRARAESSTRRAAE